MSPKIKNKDLAGVLFNRGTRNAKNGALIKAIEDFTKAIEIKPDDIMAYNNRGSAYAQQGDYIQAISDFTKAIGINSNNPVAYHNRAVAYFGLKQFDRAWADVNMVKEIGATVNPEIIRMLKEVAGEE
jgi:tetratricopeptide (TPR) repeat protein